MDPTHPSTMEVDSDSSNSDSDSDSEEKELLLKADQLEQQLAVNKYLYDVHFELVGIYYKLGDLNSMRVAYERFHECFPLTPTIWLNWLKEEIKLANASNEQKKVKELFDKAVEDYLSVDLWMEYIQYTLQVSDAKSAREIIERALQAAGLHTSKGSLLWDTLRELELAHLPLAKTEGDEEYKRQVHNLNETYRRQLSVPLIGMQNTYKEYHEWLKTLPENFVDSKPVEFGYKGAFKLLQKYEEFEEKLLVETDEQQLFDIYTKYLEILTDPSSILCVYERAVAQLCLNTSLWYDYCTYAMKLGDIALNISWRALRNCPWCEELWIIRLRIFEKQEKEPSDLLSCFEQGLTSIAPSPGLDLWLTYLEYNRRTSTDEKLYKLFQQAIEQLDFASDPSCKVKRLYSRILAKKDNIPSARKLWSGIFHQPQNKENVYMWLEYANLERQYGDANNLRQIYQRAINTCNWPHLVADEWLMYERENGTLQDVLKCLDKCKTVKMQLQPITEAPSVDKPPLKRKRDGNKQAEESSSINKKLRTKKPFTKDPKTTVFISNLLASVNESQLEKMFPNSTHIELVYDRKGKSRCYGYVQFAMEEEALSALARDREPINGRPLFISNLKESKQDEPKLKYATVLEKNKLFVRNLPQNYQKEQVENIFKEFGAKDIRLVTYKNGKSKGLAYVEFENEDLAKEAQIKTDQLDVEGHVISVAISAPPPKSNQQTKTEQSESNRHPRSRLQVNLVPRSIQLQKSSGKETNGNAATPKSNADFRNYFLNK